MVSVIIPVYNREKELPDCFRSLENQTYRDYEVILVDDGSTDGTAALCQSQVAKDDRYRFYSIAHQGVSAARNEALEHASGNLIFFLDSDDEIHPLLIETLAEALENSDATMGAAHRIAVLDRHWQHLGQLIAKHPGPGKTEYRSNEAALEAMFCDRSPLNMMGGVMIKRDVIGDTRFATDIHISEDFYFNYQNLIKGGAAIYIQQQWYYIRMHPNRSTSDYYFSGFHTRFCRRKLVWESEEALGRQEYADRQKRNAFFVYQKCIYRSKARPDDVKKMQQTMREHKKVLRSALSFTGKIQLELYILFPGLCRFVWKRKGYDKK